MKAVIVTGGMTMTEVVELLADEHGWSSSVPNLSGKLRRGLKEQIRNTVQRRLFRKPFSSIFTIHLFAANLTTLR